MTTINLERLHNRLDRGAAVAAAAAHAREQAEAAAVESRAQPDDAALSARAARLRAASNALAPRANIWSAYCATLRTFAKKHGVTV